MATSAACGPICQDPANSRKPREKRLHHHHAVHHMRPVQRPADNRQRKLRAKQRPTNLISTDGTTSDGDDNSETKNQEEQDMSNKLESMLKRNEQLASDLEADCEDNNFTDADTGSLCGSLTNKNETAAADSAHQSADVQFLHSKILALEKQLSTVLQANAKLAKENDRLKKMMADK